MFSCLSDSVKEPGYYKDEGITVLLRSLDERDSGDNFLHESPIPSIPPIKCSACSCEHHQRNALIPKNLDTTKTREQPFASLS